MSIPQLSFRTVSCVTLLLMALVACRRQPQAGVVTELAPWQRPLAQRQADPFPRVYTNRAGRRFEVLRQPERVVSATLFTDSVLLEVAAPQQLVALHEVSTKPSFSPVATASQAFGTHITADPETILAQRPDLVFLSSFSDKRVENLVGTARITVVRLDEFDDFAQIAGSLRAVGYLLGRDAAAETLVQQMQGRLQRVAAQQDKRRVWRLLSWSSGMVAGSGTTFASILACVGAQNEAARAGIEGHKRPLPEQLLQLQPHALVVGVAPGGEDAMRKQLLAHNALRNLDAVRRGRLLFVSNALMLSTSHHVAGAAERIAAQLDTWGKP